MSIEFYVHGIPQPGGSKRAFQHKHTKRIIITEDNVKSKPWRDSVISAARDAYKGPALRGPLGVRIVFHFTRPKSHYGTGKKSNVLKDSAPYTHIVKPDATKLMRSTEDALKGILWVDDSQIAQQEIFKMYADSAGAHIRVVELGKVFSTEG